MIYLDYSANTPADPAVLEAFLQTERRFWGNPNSTHPAGQAARFFFSETGKTRKTTPLDCKSCAFFTLPLRSLRFARRRIAFFAKIMYTHDGTADGSR